MTIKWAANQILLAHMNSLCSEWDPEGELSFATKEPLPFLLGANVAPFCSCRWEWLQEEGSGSLHNLGSNPEHL